MKIPKFNAVEIIKKKRDGQTLSAAELKWFIEGVVNQDIPSYQASALLMATCIRGMSKQETADLTDAMLFSGKILKNTGPYYIDKHSTGGVGDKTSFILAPIAASCGIKVPMIAGKSLGHTGGTVDKIESINGFNCNIGLEKFQNLIKKNGLCLIGQTDEIAPADKILYALRDVTATVESIHLITASIMSKKLAEGASGLVIDIKVGNGAFMKHIDDAKLLAKSIRETGIRFKKNVMTFITDMSVPLGEAVGNSLEIIECIEVLKGKGPADLAKLSLELASGMIYLGGKAASMKESLKMAKESIESTRALDKFKIMIEAQGGDIRVIDNYSLLPSSPCCTKIQSPQNGYIHHMNTEQLGMLVVRMGGGRIKTSDKIDHGVGLIIKKKTGQKVYKSETLLEIHHRLDQKKMISLLKKEILEKIYQIKPNRPLIQTPLILYKKTSWSK